MNEGETGDNQTPVADLERVGGQAAQEANHVAQIVESLLAGFPVAVRRGALLRVLVADAMAEHGPTRAFFHAGYEMEKALRAEVLRACRERVERHDASSTDQ